MARKTLKTVFLSASIPDPKRNPIYHSTGDVINIREAVRALVKVVLPSARLTFGGHPAISPFVYDMARVMDAEQRVTTYLSRHFEDKFSVEVSEQPNVVAIEAKGDRDESLTAMREAMINDDNMVAAVFIGGMEGVEEEFKLFRDRHPGKPVFPIPTTGAAARIVFDPSLMDAELAVDLQCDVVYDLLFERIFRGGKTPLL
jgi:hypothetical protein